jgi:hypothetical protein
MIYEDVEFVIRAGLGRNEWTLLSLFRPKQSFRRPAARAVMQLPPHINGSMAGCDANVKGTRDLPNPPKAGD